MKDSIHCTLILEPASPSLFFKAYRERIDEISLLERWARAVREQYPQASISVVYHDDREAAELAALFSESSPQLFKTAFLSERQTLAELTRKVDSSIIALVPLGFLLAPAGLLAKMVAHHRERNNTLTHVPDLPNSVAPILFKKSLLRNLDECGVPGLPTKTVAALDRLEQAAAMAKQEVPFPIHAMPFSAAAAYETDLSSMPHEVSLHFPSDVQRMIKAISEPATPENPLRALKRSKELSIEETEEAMRSFRQWNLAHASRPHAKKTILFVSTPSAFSGAEESLCQMIGRLDHARFECHALVSSAGVYTDRLKSAGCQVIVPGNDFSRPSVANLFYVLSVLDRIDADLVHLNGPFDMPALQAAHLRHLPTVFHLRNGDMSSYPEYVKAVDAVISISEFLKREISAFDIDPRRIHLIPDEADVEHYKPGLFDRATVRKEFGIPQDAKVALMIARFAPNKRHDLIIQAAAKIARKLPSFQLVMKSDFYSQGEAELFERVQGLIRKNDLTKRVTWLQFVPDIRKLHAMADALVLCSDREGMGRCVVEAMAMELPAVVTDNGGSHELMGDNERGYVVKAGDADDLAAQLLRALTNPDEARARAAAARRYAETALNAKTTAAQVMKIYDSLLSAQSKDL